MTTLLQKDFDLQRVLLSQVCPQCQRFHPVSKPSLEPRFKNSSDLIGDGMNLGFPQSESLSFIHQLSRAKLKESLLVETLAEGDVNLHTLCLELIQQVGGLEAVLESAFGTQFSQQSRPTSQKKQFKRREFLKQIAIATTLLTLTNCRNYSLDNQPNSTGGTKLEKTHLRIGFIPITCAAPIIIANPLGFYQKYGLTVELVKMKSWSQVRESAIAGELDAYHMLSPMPIAITLGLGSQAFPMKLASIANINGNGITVSMKHKGKIKGPADFKNLKIAIPFAHSMHNLLLRYYLATGQVNPDRDVEILIVPPTQMIEKLEKGEIDVMVVADPYNQIAVEKKVGFIHLLSRDIWPGHLCCSFATSQQWIDRHPNTFRAVNQAIIDSSNYASKVENRQTIAKAIAAPEYLNTSEEILQTVLTGQFADGLGNIRNTPDRIDFDPYPWKSYSYWITSQMMRWKAIAPDKVEHEKIADEIFLTGLARQIAKQLGQKPPSLILREETLRFDRFDPSEPNQYVKDQINKYGF